MQINKIEKGNLSDGALVSLVPYNSKDEMPESVFNALHELMNVIIEEGTTYSFEDPLNTKEFEDYYCKYFIGVAVLGDVTDPKDVKGEDVMGSFYIKPNYAGRSSHICNGGFLVMTSARGRGVGKIMAQQYVKWAPKLGYKSSVFNLVYASNIASRKLWDRLGFTVIGRVPQCARLKGMDELDDALIYGKTFDQSD